MHQINYLYILILSTFLLFSCTPKKSDTTKNADNLETTSNETLTSEAYERGYIVKVDDMAPDFEMLLTNGNKIALSSLRGKVVMLQFTASWCGVCRKEMPHIEKEIWEKHQNNPDFALFGIDREEPIEKIEELIQKTGVTYPIGLDPDAGIFTLYAERDAGITRNVIIDKDGKIVMLTRLFDEDEFKEMVKLIDNLLNT
ncbi:MAG TPA: TlpA disulfide reductase family protein [Dysgonamonadaceae bacterium]|nr:TlpA disulfide reductase family protein [Dysgonamonadaceae bacterium]